MEDGEKSHRPEQRRERKTVCGSYVTSQTGRRCGDGSEEGEGSQRSAHPPAGVARSAVCFPGEEKMSKQTGGAASAPPAEGQLLSLLNFSAGRFEVFFFPSAMSACSTRLGRPTYVATPIVGQGLKVCLSFSLSLFFSSSL